MASSLRLTKWPTLSSILRRQQHCGSPAVDGRQPRLVHAVDALSCSKRAHEHCVARLQPTGLLNAGTCEPWATTVLGPSLVGHSRLQQGTP